MKAPGLMVCRDSEALAAQAAELIAGCSQEAIRQRGRFTLVLAGGSTPEKTYALLAQPDRRDAIDWSQTYVFFGDERLVAPGDPRSNFALARRALLSRVPIPLSHVFPVPTEGRSAAAAAAAYAGQLARFFARTANGVPPRFDLILLGLGEDGHTASLFPGAPALDAEDVWVTWSAAGVLPPPVERITLTYPVLNAARQVVFLVAGQRKAAALRDVLEGQAAPDRCPAAGVHPAEGAVTWLADEEAASLLSLRMNPFNSRFVQWM